MAGTCGTTSIGQVNTTECDVSGIFTGNSPPGDRVYRDNEYGITLVTENLVASAYSTNASGVWTKRCSGLTADVTWKFRALAFFDLNWGQVYGNTISGQMMAHVAAAGTPTSSAVGMTTATIACLYTPNVTQSSCSAQLQYKKTTDPSWTDAGAAQTTGGYTQVSISRDLTGLDFDTEYQFRLVITRTTFNDTSLTSATSTFTTLEGTPVVVSDTPTSVTATSATLNGTLDINGGTGVNCYFKWDTVTPPVANVTANQSMSADGSFSQAISGLGASKYYFQAFASFATPAGSPVSGAIRAFVFAKAGSIWVEGTKLHIISSTFEIYAAEGTLVGAAVGQLGSLWVEGNNLNYIDSSGNERYITGSDEGVQSGQVGSIWHEGNYFAWLDSSQHKRLGTGVLQ